jgi:hypothetical protein
MKCCNKGILGKDQKGHVCGQNDEYAIPYEKEIAAAYNTAKQFVVSVRETRRAKQIGIILLVLLCWYHTSLPRIIVYLWIASIFVFLF